MKPFIVGIAGGTGSGKTTLALKLAGMLGTDMAALIDADAYYKDLSHLPLEQRHHINFDHPDALDTRLLIEHIQTLKQCRAVSKQLYDFAAHTRTPGTNTVNPRPIVLVDGMLIFAVDGLSRLFDLKVFVDEEADIRLLRRILRDSKERGRTIDMIADQYLRYVKPMHDQFVEPSKKRADIIIRGGDATGVFARLKAMVPQLHN